MSNYGATWGPKMSDPKSGWTEEKVLFVREKAALGWSAAQIGAKIGKTKSAIVGKCDRLGIKLHFPSGYRMSYPPGSPPFWTPDVTQKAREMWQSGMMAQKAADALGCTRAALRTKAQAAGWGKHPTVISREAASAAKPKAVVKPRPEPMIFATTCGPTDGFSLDDLEPHTCRYPLNDVPAHAIETMRFCGDEAMDGSAYCVGHHQLAYQPLRPRSDRIERLAVR
jgi:GcrA cell cycle regulator